MIVSLNGQKKEFSGPLTLKNIVEKFCQSGPQVIAEVNGKIIKKESWDSQEVKNGDCIELLNLVGGG
ncbi:MAG: sulfur carrier protein ThiS [Candidatus Omnitrophota bacterium]